MACNFGASAAAPSPGPAELIERRKHLPPVDPASMRRDPELVVESSLR